MSAAYGFETVLEVHHWTDAYFSFTTTRDTGFRFDNGQFVMIGISAIESDGSLRDFDLREVKVAQTIIGQSREVWLAADHSKFRRQAMVELARLNQIDRLFTDVDWRERTSSTSCN